MFSMIRGLLLVVLCLVGIGLYRGWFSFSRSSGDPQDNRVNIGVSIDKNKIAADAERVEQRIKEKVAKRLGERAGATTTPEVK